MCDGLIPVVYTTFTHTHAHTGSHECRSLNSRLFGFRFMCWVLPFKQHLRLQLYLILQYYNTLILRGRVVQNGVEFCSWYFFTVEQIFGPHFLKKQIFSFAVFSLRVRLWILIVLVQSFFSFYNVRSIPKRHNVYNLPTSIH